MTRATQGQEPSIRVAKEASSKRDDRLENAVKEMIAFEAGESSTPVSEVTMSVDSPDVAGMRRSLGYSQEQFADVLDIPVATLRNWEQGRRNPTNATKLLLRIFSLSPDAVIAAANEGSMRSHASPVPATPSDRPPMVKDNLVAAVADATRLPRADAQSAVDAVFATIAGELKRGGEVRLAGFGNFVASRTAAITASSADKDAKPQMRTTPKFMPGKGLKDAMN